MVGAVLIVVDQPRLQRLVQQRDIVDAAAVEVGSVELLQDGAVEAFADRVVVGRPRRYPVMGQPQLRGAGLEGLADDLRPVEFLSPNPPMDRLGAA